MAMHIDEKLSFGRRIPHRNWKLALAESFALIYMATPGEVINITGPSRVGKSRLVDELVKMLNGDNVFEETGILPVVSVCAVNKGNNGVFSTKAFSQSLLHASEHPIYCARDLTDTDKSKKLVYDNTSEATYMTAFAEAIVHRKTRFLFIDEAQHVVYTSKDAMAPTAVMESWKSFAEDNDLVLVIVGAYPILRITSHSTHMLGRISRVHFSRYLEEEDDLEAFKEIVLTYEKLMNLDRALGSLVNHLEMLYRGSLGCIGLLRKWLKAASLFAHAMNKPVDMKMLIRSAPSVEDYKRIQNEIDEGEYYLRSIFEPSDKAATKDVTSAKSNIPRSKGAGPKRKEGSKPFQRKPKRMEANNRGVLEE